MATSNKALMCGFRPSTPVSTDAMREKFSASYARFMDMDTVEYKCGWANPEKGERGALYVFSSGEALDDDVTSDVWLKVVPEKYGCTREWAVVEPGPILSKKVITRAQDSWISR